MGVGRWADDAQRSGSTSVSQLLQNQYAAAGQGDQQGRPKYKRVYMGWGHWCGVGAAGQGKYKIEFTWQGGRGGWYKMWYENGIGVGVATTGNIKANKVSTKECFITAAVNLICCCFGWSRQQRGISLVYNYGSMSLSCEGKILTFPADFGSTGSTQNYISWITKHWKHVQGILAKRWLFLQTFLKCRYKNNNFCTFKRW